MKEKSTPTPAPEENVAQEGAQGLKKEIEAAVEAMVNEHLQRALVGLLRGDEREAARGLAHYEYLKDLQGKADRPLRPREFMDYYCGDDVCEHGKRLYENCERCLPPAPPPCAAPAEETSSGGERCEAATAGGAFFCCEAMQGALAQRFAEMEVAQWRISFLLVRLKTSKAGYPVKEFYRQPLRRCPWCGSPLERDDVPLAPEQYEEARELLAPAGLTLDETGCIQPLAETSPPRTRS